MNEKEMHRQHKCFQQINIKSFVEVLSALTDVRAEITYGTQIRRGINKYTNKKTNPIKNLFQKIKIQNFINH